MIKIEDLTDRDIKEYLKENSKQTLKMFHSGWELDETIWIMQDNTVIATSNNQYYIMSKDEIKEYIEEIEANLSPLKEIVDYGL